MIFFRQPVHDPVQLRKFLVSDVDALEHAVEERRPCLYSHFLQSAIFDHAAVPAAARIITDIHIEPCVNGGAVGHGILYLVHAQGLCQAAVQQLYLHGIMVADAKGADFSGLFQDVESLRHLLRLHQRVRAVQQQDVDVIGLKALQAAVHGLQYVFLGKVIADAGADGALGLYHHMAAQFRGQYLPEPALRLSPCVDVRMVEEIDARLHGSLHQLPQGLAVQACNSHTSKADGRCLRQVFIDFQHFHEMHSSIFRFSVSVLSWKGLEEIPLFSVVIWKSTSIRHTCG